jgi:HTH-type transcriptional regulator/antitoxin HipB
VDVVYLTNARDVGHAIRDRRQELNLSQAQLADAAGVSRRWLLALESGKPTAQLDLVLRTLDALGLVVDVRAELTPGDVDLVELVSDHRRPADG